MSNSSLKSIAKKLSLSELTVSRVLNDYKDISQSTKKLAGIRIKSDFLQVADLNFDGGKIAMDKLLKLKQLPTAVSCVSDTVAMGAMQSIRNHNLSPGKEISLIGYDGLELGAWIDPPLSTMTQPIQTVGKDHAEMLVNLVKGKKNHRTFRSLFKLIFKKRN